MMILMTVFLDLDDRSSHLFITFYSYSQFESVDHFKVNIASHIVTYPSLTL